VSDSVVLDKGDYFELRTAIRDVEVVELDAMKAAQEFARQQKAAMAARTALLDRLAAQYGFDPALEYRWNDAERSLTPVQSAPRS